MTFEELQHATEDELRTFASSRFDKYSKSSYPSRVELLWEAQFFMRELEHRETERERAATEKERRSGRWIGLRDVILEGVVIFLIGGEIWLAIKQGNDEDALMDKQNGILTNLQKSSSDTADAIKNLSNITQSMNDALQKQLGIYYDVSLHVAVDPSTKSLIIENTGRTNVTMWGSKTGNQPDNITPPRVLTPTGKSSIPMTDQYEYFQKALPKGQTGILSYLMYVRNERGENFVVKCEFQTQWTGGVLGVGARTISVTPMLPRGKPKSKK